jgi:glucose/mannose-6-phosphate isomerase
MNTTDTIQLAQQRMEQFTHEFPSDLKQSLEIAKENPVQFAKSKIHNIVICGMGGSGIGGMIARDILLEHQTVPVDFCKGYTIPNYVDERSLVICSSYSGNTEETLQLFEQAQTRKAQVISICSGGELCERTKKAGYQNILIPGEKQPRAAVGLSLVQQLHILGELFLSQKQKEELFSNIEDTANKLAEKTEAYQKNATAIAKDLHLKNISLFTDTQHASIATRFTQQINENVKKKAHSAIIPEMNHNELVAFVDYSKMDAVIFINPNRFNKQNEKRCAFLKQELKKQNSNIIEISSEGKSNTPIFLKTIYVLDLVSIELAKIKDVDSEQVEVIHRLKETIAI